MGWEWPEESPLPPSLCELEVMYKDKDKQREANRERQRRYKAKQKALLSEGVTEVDRKQIEKDMVAIGLKPVTKLSPKRGKDIKCFEDLPPDVQECIDRISDSPEEKVKRTVAAIKYQHIFPDTISKGIGIIKKGIGVPGG